MKLLSPGAILLVWMPVIGGCGFILVYGVQYWYMALGAFGFAFFMLMMVFGSQSAQAVSDNERQDAEITEYCDDLRYQRMSLLGVLGKPVNNGDWSADQKAIWTQIKALENQEAEFLKETKVINLDSLGHNIGRVYKNRNAVKQVRVATNPKRARLGWK